MAKSYATLFAPVKGAGAGKALHLIPPDAFLNIVKAKEPLVVLDIRTPAETGVYSVTLPGSLVIPVNELFTEASLDLIPTDKTVVVVCLSGTRASAAGTALRHIGFENVYILKGGFKALTGYLGPKEANTPLKPAVKK
jgi:rhodanese-related sulfurtransferase